MKGVELLQVGIALFGYSALKHKQNDTMDELQLEVIQYASQEPEKFEEVLKDKEGQSVKSFVYLASSLWVISHWWHSLHIARKFSVSSHSEEAKELGISKS